jgi:PKD repeat protein
MLWRWGMGKRLAVLGLFCFSVLWLMSAYGQETTTLTIRSQYGTPSPPVGTQTNIPINTVITASVATPVYSTSPGIRYVCTGWRARGSPDTLPAYGTTNSVTFTITINTTITWRWKTQYLVTTSVSPPGSGRIDVWPPSPDGWYDAKSIVTFFAIANEGYDFSHWTGGLRGTANPQTIWLRGPREVIANFIREKRYFVVIVGSPGGVPDPPEGVHEYNYGDTVTANCGLTPHSAGEGVQHVCTGHLGTGDVTDGSETSISFIIHHDSSVTWLWQLQYRLTTAANPPEFGTVTPSDETWHAEGSVVTMTATPNEGYAFANWSGALSGTTNPQTITMDSAKNVTANFAAEVPVADFTGTPTSGPAPLTVNFTDASTGLVTSYEWDFDNNGTVDSTLQNPSHTYSSVGTYTVKLTVTGPAGSDTDARIGYITVTERNWVLRSPTNKPPARKHHAIAYDSNRAVVVLFGGHNDSGQWYNDTWEWDGTQWTQKYPASKPTARLDHAMAYDSNRGVVVLFGGRKIESPWINDETWEWDGANWTQRSPANKPSPRERPAMAYDSNRGVVVLFGGYTGSDNEETWEY